MSRTLNKILASTSAALMLGGIVTIAPSSKASAMYPAPGVPAYKIPVGSTFAIPAYGVPTYKVPVAAPATQPHAVTITAHNVAVGVEPCIMKSPTPIRLPRNYRLHYNYVVCCGKICPLTVCGNYFQYFNQYYPVYYY